LMERYMAEVGVPIERLGALLVAWSEEQCQLLPALLAQAHQNGVTDLRLLTAGEIYAHEPHLNAGVFGGVWVPGESILCSFTLPLAFATQAVVNGVTLKLNFPVRQIHREEDGFYGLTGEGGSVRSRYLVNAAGLYADEINQLLGHAEFSVTPRRGELIVYDKLARSLVNHILLPVPTGHSKGVLIAPTVYGNVLLGPTAENLQDKQARGTSVEGLQMLRDKGRAILPALLEEEVTACYAGLRAATEQSDYQIHAHPMERYVCVGGIRSTGVSAAMGIAEYVVELLAEAAMPLLPKPEFALIEMPYIGECGTRPYQSPAMIAADPAYGRIVCYCERVTLGEIVAATHAVVPACTLDGLRRRTRVLQGRCQGFNCHAAVTAILARATGQEMDELLNLSAAGPALPGRILEPSHAT
jgi:glycerol-3-phosphate dehydrogenase